MKSAAKIVETTAAERRIKAGDGIKDKGSKLDRDTTELDSLLFEELLL